MSRQESLYLPWPPRGEGTKPTESLHIRHFFPEFAASPDADAQARLGAPILLLHGAIGNCGIFYTESGKGLGPFLARHGFDVYALDLRGRGGSVPHISRRSRYGQFEAIVDEIPAFIEFVRARRGEVPQFWMAHSWGGVLALAVLARRPEYRKLVKGAVFFGTKRSVHVRGWEAALKIRFFWNWAARWLVGLHGYLPARAYGAGADDETALSHAESRAWVRPGAWVDPRDGFAYERELPAAALPPLLFLAGAGDACLGHPQDVRALIRELGPQEIEYRLLARRTGNRHDYGHVDMLTHPDAPDDHFLEALKWIRKLASGA